MKCRVREQRHICGATKESANYQEVDFFLITERQHKASTRAKKEMASTLVQKNLNEENSIRWFSQLAHTNFDEDDYIVHTTFEDKHHPSTEDNAWKVFERFIDRINYHRSKLELPLVKYMGVLELRGKRSMRYHFHILMDGLLPHKIIRSLWSTGRGRGRERLGSCRIEDLDFEGHGGTILGLCNYIGKDPEGKRRWKQSQGLKKPKRPRPNDSKYSRSKLAQMCQNRIDDHEWWCQQYPGWELVEPATAKYNDFTGWSMYAKMRRIKHPRGQPAKRKRNK